MGMLTLTAREVGGWRSVLCGRRRREQGSVPGKPGLYTIFMDNIPLSMNPKGLYELFKKFRVVRDVCIPNKTRKTTRLRFGFVRYDCSVAAEMAAQKANGVWCDDKALWGKFAEFTKDTSGARGMGQSAKGRKGNRRAEQVGRS
ncbi:nuclear localization sequence-binding protein-like [Camellia sinensis]|uniref:nuclear localization sequence-binding protein-like n=1 Tax=Camellia sinensis TaxID=4442 RepID=UPI0010356887|nr:nuclear localization sequence-binding protein-like [Camellia sinensis]